jgi:hypothetical protein
MRPNDVDRLIGHLEAQPSASLDRRIEALLDLQPRVMPAGGWRRAVRSRVARFAVAAAVLLVIAMSIPFFNGDHSNVWAQVLENTSNISNYTYRVMISQKAPGSLETETMIQSGMYYVSEGHVALVESYVNGGLERRSYYARDDNEVIEIHPATREYERRPGVASRDETPREMAKWLLTGRYVELGRKTVEGRVLVGLTTRRVPDWLPEYIVDWHQEIWFDEETKLPVVSQMSSTDKRSGLSWVNRQDQFRYGVEFSASLFEPKIPEDYTPTVINGLRLFSELTDGRYPTQANLGTVQNELGNQAQVEEAIRVGTLPSGKYGYDGIIRAAGFLDMVQRGSRDFAYHGNRVTAKDNNLVLTYWSRPGGDYEVIWGDLRMESLAKDQLIQRCYAAGDSGCLLAFLEKDDGARVPVLAEYLGQTGDRSVVPALLRHLDLWQDSPADNPFPRALEAIRQRQEQQNPSLALLAGRLLYANGRPVTNGFLRIGAESGQADREGYFAMMAPCGDPNVEHYGYAWQRPGTNARLFSWKKTNRSEYPIIVLEWVGTVRGRVVNQEGAPRSGIRVSLSPLLGGKAGHTWPDGKQTGTDAQGRFVFAEVPVGAPLEVVIENPDKVDTPLRVRIDDLAGDQKYDTGDIVLKRP